MPPTVRNYEREIASRRFKPFEVSNSPAKPPTESPERANDSSPGQARICERAALGKTSQILPDFAKPRDSANPICGIPR
jgi:hypothetical protein